MIFHFEEKKESWEAIGEATPAKSDKNKITLYKFHSFRHKANFL